MLVSALRSAAAAALAPAVFEKLPPPLGLAQPFRLVGDELLSTSCHVAAASAALLTKPVLKW